MMDTSGKLLPGGVGSLDGAGLLEKYLKGELRRRASVTLFKGSDCRLQSFHSEQKLDSFSQGVLVNQAAGRVG